MHQELSALRNMVDTRSRIRLVEPKTLVPDWFGKNKGPSWRIWSCLAGNFVGVVHATQKQAMKAGENQKQPIAVTHLQHENKVTNVMDQEMQHFLVSRTEGEALEIVRGAERGEPGLEQWRRLAGDWLLCVPHQQPTAGKSCLHRKPPKWTHHPSLGKFGTTPPRTHWRPVAKRHATGCSSFHVLH